MHMIEELETRQLLAADLTLGDFKLTGAPLFQPGGTTTVIVMLRSQISGSGSVDFKYVDIGFSANQHVAFDDPAAVELSTIAVSGVPVGPAGKSFSFPLAFPADLTAGRYALVGKISAATATADDVTRLFGVARTLPTDGNLAVAGTEGADHIAITAAGATFEVNVNNYIESFGSTDIKAFTIDSKGGNDVVVLSGAVPKVHASGGDGNDKLVGGDGNDTLSGGAGKDSLYGGAGEDRLNGNGGNDRLFGETGVDRLYGYGGNDYLDAGAASDRLDGGAGIDTLFGQGGNDRFFTRDSEIDFLFGGSGADTATHDSVDVLNSI